MMRFVAFLATALLAGAGCGSPSESPPEGAGATGGSSSGAAGMSGSAGSAGSAGAVDAGFDGASRSDAGSGGSAGSAPDASSIAPHQPGPVPTTPFDATATVAATGHSVPMHCVVPNDGGPHPIVLIAHGFQLAASQYHGYAERLGSFGYVACTADYPAGFSPNHAESAKDLSGALDWAIAASSASGNPLSGKVDATRAGVMGHSLGGKLAVLAAKQDARFGAVLGLDPVDSSMFCNPTACPDASSALPLAVPTAFLGETLDATAGVGGQACAPAADNFQTFFSAASSPSYELTFQGANHMSFIDDPAGCGLVCSFCKPATLAHAQAIDMARALSVAFFERHLRGRLEYETWLAGAEAKSLWVDTGLLAILAK